jgi:uncharacterized protein YecE (DUF72 family)
MAGKCFIGTSGWSYDHWIGPFYPVDVSGDAMLPFYAETFDTVEINNTFYRLPNKDVVKSWRDATPDDFLFSIKANRYITHMKNLKEAERPVERLTQTVALLGDKLGPILFQLPPQWHVNVDRLRSFVEVLPKRYRYVFEMRHNSWYQKKIFDTLRQANAALCIHDISGETSPTKDTSDFIYLRFHGPEGEYRGSYPTEVIETWAKQIKAWNKSGKTVYGYFNNDYQAHAVHNAKTLRKLL